MQNGGLVKTVKFSNPKYVGDPINAVRIFNEKEVDELVFLDIDATAQRREPDYALIASIAGECRMPLCYGGGIKTVEQVEMIVSLGVEKVAIGSAAIDTPGLIAEAAARVGNQSIVAVMDVKKTGVLKRYELFTHNGGRKTGVAPVDFARKVQEEGAGEILVNVIDKDGTMSGYDIALACELREATHIPMSILGGAGNMEDIEELFRNCGVVGAAAGSMFVFKGKYKAVLIQYPDQGEREKIYDRLG